MSFSHPRTQQHHIFETTIGSNSIFVGVLTTAGNVQVDGVFEGDINSSRHIQISQLGRVRATINALTCTIKGSITGKIIAQHDVVIESTARAWCEIDSPALRVEPGAVFKGMSHGKHDDPVIL